MSFADEVRRQREDAAQRRVRAGHDDAARAQAAEVARSVEQTAKARAAHYVAEAAAYLRKAKVRPVPADHRTRPRLFGPDVRRHPFRVWPLRSYVVTDERRPRLVPFRDSGRRDTPVAQAMLRESEELTWQRLPRGTGMSTPKWTIIRELADDRFPRSLVTCRDWYGDTSTDHDDAEPFLYIGQYVSYSDAEGDYRDPLYVPLKDWLAAEVADLVDRH